MEAITLEGKEAVFMEHIQQSGQYDNLVVKGLKALDVGELCSNEWMHVEGVVLYRGRVYIPDNPQLHHDLVHVHHSTIVAGHPGHWKTLELVSQNYWWPGLSRYIAKFITGCDACNWCRQDISLVSNAPIGTGFDPQNITVIMSQESHHQHAFLIRIAETIFHMCSKLRRNYAIKCVYFLRFQRWYIRPNPCIIDGDVITTRIFTGFGKSVHRAVWRGFWHCLERRTSGLVIVGSIRVLGPSLNSQVLLKIARSHIGCNLFGPYLLFYCMDSSQIWYRWKGIFEENPTLYVTKDEDYSLWKTSAITEIAPLGSFQSSTMTKPLVRRSRQCQKPLQITLRTDFPNPVNIHVVITSPSIVHGLRCMWYHWNRRN